MNGEFSRIFLILAMGILIVCLPAQAAHAGQAGSSSPINDHGAQVNLTSGSSAGSSPDFVGKASGIDTSSSASSQALVQTRSVVTASAKAQDSPGTAEKSTQSESVNTNAGSSPLTGLSGNNAGRSDLDNNGRAEAAGMDSPQRTGRENAAGNPDAQKESKESGRLAGMMFSPMSVAAASSGSKGENRLYSCTGCQSWAVTAAPTTRASLTIRELSLRSCTGKPAPSGVRPDPGRIQRGDALAAKV